MTSIITAADIQNYAPELDLSQYNAATISGMCAQATSRAASFCNVEGFDFAQQVDEMDRAYISNDGELQISVHRRPIIEVTSVSLVKGGFSTDLNLTDSGNDLFQIPYPGNKFVFPNSFFYLTGTYLAGGSSQLYTLRGAKVFYKMSYYGGWQTIPDDLKLACVLYFRDIMSNRGRTGVNGAPLTGFTQGSYSENYASSGNKNGVSSFVLEAQGILMNGGYCRVEF